MAITVTAPSVYIKPVYRIHARTRRLANVGDVRMVLGHHWIDVTNTISSGNVDRRPGDSGSISTGDLMRVVEVNGDFVKVRLSTARVAYGAAAPTGSEFVLTHEAFFAGRS